MDPMSLIMLGLIGLLIIFMVRNGRKRREQMSQLQQGLVPGAQVMLQSGIFGEFLKADEDDENRIHILSGDSTFVVHRNAIANLVPTPEVEQTEPNASLAPDDDPEFGERLDRLTEKDDNGETDERPDADDRK